MHNADVRQMHNWESDLDKEIKEGLWQEVIINSGNAEMKEGRAGAVPVIGRRRMTTRGKKNTSV